MVRLFKRTFAAHALNELGKQTRLCRRERQVTPFRLALSLIECLGSGQVRCIADLHRGFNALCESSVRYKPFHNQLAKPGFAVFMRELLSRLLNELACEVLRFRPDSPFTRFTHIRIQDGTSFALKSTLADTFPGRWRKQKPAAVELHVDLDVFSEAMNRVVLSPDSMPERQFLPEPHEAAGGLVLADRGYYAQTYLRALNDAGAAFIVRAKRDITPLIVEAIDPTGRTVKGFANRRLSEVRSKFSRYEHLDLTVQFAHPDGPWRCRLIVHRNPTADCPRYLLTNLDRESFSVEHISDGYRLRWQIELLFKEWKSYSNLQAFDTSNAAIAEGLIWAALCAATVKRYCAHMAQRLARVAISTQVVAKCIHHVLDDVCRALVHHPNRVRMTLLRAMNYLAANARRAHPNRDRHKGRLKLGLEHVYA
jgi:hypothetical protein